MCASNFFRWPSGKAVWLWHSLAMTQHCVRQRHNNDGCLQVALTTWLHCTTHHRYMEEGLCLLTCKEIGLFFKSMSLKNVSSFGHYFRRLATLNLNYKYEMIQSLALFTSDYAGLLKLSKNCMGMGGEKGQRTIPHYHTQAHRHIMTEWCTQI